MQSAPVQRANVQRENDRAPSPNAGPQFPLTAEYQISNRNTTEFRISLNPNKTQRISISNRNINPNVAVSFSPRNRRLTLATQEPHLPTGPFLITDPRLESTPKPKKTKLRDDF
jgi:hypothetical protein